jgi:formylmethanofuran dehydrogenase subunit E
MINDDMFKCDKCNNWFSIDDSIQIGKEKLCVECAKGGN